MGPLININFITLTKSTRLVHQSNTDYISCSFTGGNEINWSRGCGSGNYIQTLPRYVHEYVKMDVNCNYHGKSKALSASLMRTQTYNKGRLAWMINLNTPLHESYFCKIVFNAASPSILRGNRLEGVGLFIRLEFALWSSPNNIALSSFCEA